MLAKCEEEKKGAKLKMLPGEEVLAACLSGRGKCTATREQLHVLASQLEVGVHTPTI